MTACVECGTPSYSAARNCASCPAFSEWPIDPDAPAERKPSAGWIVESSEWERYRLTGGGHVARVWRSSDGGVRWRLDDCDVQFDTPSILAAQFAAEDALLAIAAEIVGAVGR